MFVTVRIMMSITGGLGSSSVSFLRASWTGSRLTLFLSQILPLYTDVGSVHCPLNMSASPIRINPSIILPVLLFCVRNVMEIAV